MSCLGRLSAQSIRIRARKGSIQLSFSLDVTAATYNLVGSTGSEEDGGASGKILNTCAHSAASHGSYGGLKLFWEF